MFNIDVCAPMFNIDVTDNVNSNIKTQYQIVDNSVFLGGNFFFFFMVSITGDHKSFCI